MCSNEQQYGKPFPIPRVGCEIFCHQQEIECRQNSSTGNLEWHPHNPCRSITTTTSTASTSTTTQAATIPPQFTKTTLPNPLTTPFQYQEAFDSSTMPSFHFSPGISVMSDVVDALEPVVSPSEQGNPQKKQAYGLGWLVSEPELELILWVMFGVALLLMILGLIGLVGFICHKRRVKNQLKVSGSPRFYDANRQSVLAYDRAPYSPGLEYEKLRPSGSSGCYWPGQQTNSRSTGAVRLIASPQVDICSPYCTAKRAVNHSSYLQQVVLPNSSYKQATNPSDPAQTSTYQLVTFAPPVNTIGRRTSFDVPCIRGLDSKRESGEDCQAQDYLTVTPSPPIPLGGDTYLVSSFHQGGDNVFRVHGDLIDDQDNSPKHTNV